MGGVSVATREDRIDLLRQITRLQHERGQEEDALVQRELDDQIRALQKRSSSSRDSLSVGSIINVPATGKDIVGA